MTRTLLDFAAPLVFLLAYSASACWAPPSDAPSGSERLEVVAEDAALPAMAVLEREDKTLEREGAPSVPVVEREGDAKETREKAPAWLVWGRDEAGFTSTWWVAPDEPIDPESAAGTVLAIDGALWYWVVEEEPVAAKLDCDLLAEVADEEGIGVRAALQRVDGGARREVLSPSVDDARASAQFEEHAVLTGSIGPYLFVHRSAESYHCGAHGGSEHASFVWDARAEAPVHVYAAEQLELVRAASETRARAQLAAATDGESALFGDEVELTLLRPTFAPSGAAELAHRWTAAVPYALSDGGWSAYTASTELFGNALPGVLAPHAAGSAEAVRRVREAAPGITIGGVSAADPALREPFQALPGEGC